MNRNDKDAKTYKRNKIKRQVFQVAYKSNNSNVFDLYDKALTQTRDRLEERVD